MERRRAHLIKLGGSTGAPNARGERAWRGRPSREVVAATPGAFDSVLLDICASIELTSIFAISFVFVRDAGGLARQARRRAPQSRAREGGAAQGAFFSSVFSTC